MFGTVIGTDKKGNLVPKQKFYELCPELFAVYKDKNLGGPMLKWLVNVYDRKSIYRFLPPDVRREDVAEAIFGDKNYPRLNHPKVQKAIELYEYVMYDPLIAEYNAVNNNHRKKIEIYNSIEVTDDNMNKLHRYEKDIKDSTQYLKQLKEQILIEDEQRQMMGTDSDELSFIEEKLLQRQREFTNE